jgi:diguanylate cyclase (GGDEF)-like protein
MRILIADDSLVMRRLLEVTLRGWGYEVVSATDGAEAWDILQSEDAPPLAILDWIMPVFTGPEVCHLVRSLARPAYTYILLLTSKSQREDIVQGIDAGADDYVTKPFDQHELEARLRAGRRIVDLQMQVMQAHEELRDQATRDSLTRCWNRAYIMDALAREIDRAMRENRWLGLLMLDLDHFKSINDNYGHSAGDAALRDVVGRMLASMRSYDLLGRYGGEEFLVILPGCDENFTVQQGERLRQVIVSEPVDIGAAHLTVTGSFGAVSLPPGFAATPDQLLKLADEALYRAKRMGRNAVALMGAETLASSPGSAA